MNEALVYKTTSVGKTEDTQLRLCYGRHKALYLMRNDPQLTFPDLTKAADVSGVELLSLIRMGFVEELPGYVIRDMSEEELGLMIDLRRLNVRPKLTQAGNRQAKGFKP